MKDNSISKMERGEREREMEKGGSQSQREPEKEEGWKGERERWGHCQKE